MITKKIQKNRTMTSNGYIERAECQYVNCVRIPYKEVGNNDPNQINYDE